MFFNVSNYYIFIVKRKFYYIFFSWPKTNVFCIWMNVPYQCLKLKRFITFGIGKGHSIKMKKTFFLAAIKTKTL